MQLRTGKTRVREVKRADNTLSTTNPTRIASDGYRPPHAEARPMTWPTATCPSVAANNYVSPLYEIHPSNNHCHTEPAVCCVLYCTVLYCTCCAVLCCTVLCCTVLYCTVLYCTVLYLLCIRYQFWQLGLLSALTGYIPHIPSLVL